MPTVHACKQASDVIRAGSVAVNRTSIDSVTIGNVVVLLEPGPQGAELERLKRHEAMHMTQQARAAPGWARPLPKSIRVWLGAPRHARAYLEEWRRVGYWNNKFEIEARAAEEG